MKNVALDRATALQPDANGTDSALDAAADCHVLRNDAALDLCTLADLEIRSAHFAFNSAEDLCWTIAFDVADDRHVGADARGHSRFCRRFCPRPLVMMYYPAYDLSRPYRRVSVFLGHAVLRAGQHFHLLFRRYEDTMRKSADSSTQR